MPELPEVQTVVNQLNIEIVGKTFAGFTSAWPKKVLTSDLDTKIQGLQVLGARRIGKHIIIDLTQGESLVIHLKMTGHLLYKTPVTKNNKAFTEDSYNGFLHHQFTFTDGSTLEFSDMRKFGWVLLVPTVEVPAVAGIKALGIDALSPELTPKKFAGLFAKKEGRTIGEVLLDQALIAGIGNIYRSEALFLAGIVPTRRVGMVTDAEWQKLLKSVQKTLNTASSLGGTSDGDFRDIYGLPGRHEDALYVYQRQGRPCKKCATIIVRNKLGQRSIFVCPLCQQ
jgi:formamidopyrimidine-DNA glycosylase